MPLYKLLISLFATEVLKAFYFYKHIFSITKFCEILILSYCYFL